MPQTIRFHLDETCRRAVGGRLRLRGIDVTTTTDAGLLGATDPVQLAHARSQGPVLFTHDAGFPHSGLVSCHQYRHPLGAVIRRLVLLWATREASELIGQLIYL